MLDEDVVDAVAANENELREILARFHDTKSKGRNEEAMKRGTMQERKMEGKRRSLRPEMGLTS